MLTKLSQLLESAEKNHKRIAVAQAADDEVLKAVKATGQDKKLASFTLIADREKLLPLLDRHGLDICRYSIIHMTDEAAMARRSVEMVRAGEADLPMKGHLHSGTYFKAVLDKDNGLRGPGVLSELSVFEKDWDREGLQIATCCAININPSLAEKVHIINNAVLLANALGIDLPKVAALSAMEQVNPNMPETLDAAALSKMADRGQIKGALVDGPFALDNVMSLEQARHKGLSGPVAGQADILLMSDVRMGNMFHKCLTYLARKRVAIAVLGATVPVIFNSRSDFPEDRILSIALALHLCGTAYAQPGKQAGQA